MLMGSGKDLLYTGTHLRMGEASVSVVCIMSLQSRVYEKIGEGDLFFSPPICNKRGGSFTSCHGSHDLLCVPCRFVSIHKLTSCRVMNSPLFSCSRTDGLVNL